MKINNNVQQEINKKFPKKKIYDLKINCHELMEEFDSYIYTYLTQYCPQEEKQITRQKYQRRPNRGLEKLRNQKKQCRKELKRLKNEGLEHLQYYKYLMRQWRDLMKKHNKLRLAVSKGEKAKAQKRTEKLFRKDPHKFAQNVFRKKVARAPTFSKAVAQEFYTRTYHDADREHMYEAMPEMVRPQVPVSPFNTEAPTFKEVQEIVHHKRNAAAPGPNGIPYTVYKKCPSILKKLHEIFLRIWKDGDIPDNWGVGFISLISKSEV